MALRTVVALLLGIPNGTLGDVVVSSTIVHSAKQSSLNASHRLCKITQVVVISRTLDAQQSFLFSKHLYLPFNRPNAFSTTIWARLCR